jgi:uncharacterized protein YdiU (UPF0061 family)
MLPLLLTSCLQELCSTYNSKMAAKLGLQSHDQTLTTELLTLMAQSEADWTNTFRALAHIPTADSNGSSSSSSSAANNNGSSSSSSLAEADAAQEQQPLASAEAAVDAALAAGLPQRLIDALSAEQLQQQPQVIESWAAWLRVWRGRLAEEGVPDEQRMAMQMAASPKFVPRQHLLQVRLLRGFVNGCVVCLPTQIVCLVFCCSSYGVGWPLLAVSLHVNWCLMSAWQCRWLLAPSLCHVSTCCR